MNPHYVNFLGDVKLNSKPSPATRALFVVAQGDTGAGGGADTVIKMAHVAGVGRPLVYAALRVLRNGDDGLLKAVLGGSLSLTRAAAKVKHVSGAVR